MSDACKHATLGCNYPEGECAGACTGAQSEALRLADVLDLLAMDMKTPRQAAAELRRLHAANLDCIAWYEAAKAERDDLLEALKTLTAYLGKTATHTSDMEAVWDAEKVIRKATGEQA